jgi:hypothetical protein
MAGSFLRAERIRDEANGIDAGRCTEKTVGGPHKPSREVIAKFANREQAAGHWG